MKYFTGAAKRNLWLLWHYGMAITCQPPEPVTVYTWWLLASIPHWFLPLGEFLRHSIAGARVFPMNCLN